MRDIAYAALRPELRDATGWSLHSAAMLRRSAAVATSREGHGSPRSDRAGQRLRGSSVCAPCVECGSPFHFLVETEAKARHRLGWLGWIVLPSFYPSMLGA